MLVLSRKPLQKIVIGSDILVTVVKIERNQVRLGISAPPGIPILREELTSKPPTGSARPVVRSDRGS
jgi:carbon storage regulator